MKRIPSRLTAPVLAVLTTITLFALAPPAWAGPLDQAPALGLSKKAVAAVVVVIVLAAGGAAAYWYTQRDK